VGETFKEWLKQCYSVRISDLSKIGDLNESFILGAYGFIKVKYLGSFHVLLKGKTKLELKKLLRGIKNGSKSYLTP